MVGRTSCQYCGAPLGKDGQTCAFCSARVRPLERVPTILCGKCFTRLPGDARFCRFCQQPVQEQNVAPLAAEAECPRCRAELRGRDLKAGQVVECPGCGGLWLEPDMFNRLCQRTAHERDSTLTGPRPELVGPAQDSHPMAYLKCPTCGDMMVRRNFGVRSGVIIDVCRDHGVWLDLQEWERIREYILAGGPRWV